MPNLPSHDWAAEQGAVFVETSAWLRAQWFPRESETDWCESGDRQVMATREGVGICGVTTLGKIAIQGSDAAFFLDRVYANTFSTLPVGKRRYGLMLREEGMVKDDGTTARLSEHHYVMRTTIANAVTVFRDLEFCRKCLWPGMDVRLVSTTEQWARFAVPARYGDAMIRVLMQAGGEYGAAAYGTEALGVMRIEKGRAAGTS